MCQVKSRRVRASASGGSTSLMWCRLAALPGCRGSRPAVATALGVGFVARVRPPVPGGALVRVGVEVGLARDAFPVVPAEALLRRRAHPANEGLGCVVLVARDG